MRFNARAAAPAAVFAFLLAAAGCEEFHLEGPEDPTPLNPPTLVSVTVEYRQTLNCLNVPDRCGDPVVFFASWAPLGSAFPLTRDAGGLIWRGRIDGVPANFPPVDEPYSVSIFDPHLVGLPTRGATANRITVGGQLLTRMVDGGTRRESALVYIDEDGFGHNPF